MSKDKGGRAAKKPKAAKNIKVKGQTPAQGSGAVSTATAKGGAQASRAASVTR